MRNNIYIILGFVLIIFVSPCLSAEVASLHEAAKAGDIEKVRVLLDQGMDVNARNEVGNLALAYAIWERNLAMAELLLANRADIDLKDSDGWTSFRIAVNSGAQEFVKLFINRGTKITNIHRAACAGDLAKVESFIQQGININVKDEFSWTPLFWATCTCQEKVVEFLLARGADANIRTDDGNTPLLHALHRGFVQLVELFISKGVDVNVRDDLGWTPLYAAAAGQAQLVELLITKGADVNAKTKANWTPLHRAAWGGHKDVIEVLIAHGADVTILNNRKRTALEIAKQRGHTEIVELLFSNKSAINSALLGAAGEGDIQFINELLNRGADVNTQDSFGRRPLHYAVGGGLREIETSAWKPEENRLSVGVVTLLTEREADVNVQDKYGLSPLHYATVNMNKDTVLLLLNNGARVDIRDNADREPMHYAFGAGPGFLFPENWSVDIAKLLLEHGANIDAQDNIGWTPMHYSTIAGEPNGIKFLVERNANIDCADNRGGTPYLLASAIAGYRANILGSKYYHPWHDAFPVILDILRRAYDDRVIEPNIPVVDKESLQVPFEAIHAGLCFVATNGKDTNPGTLELPLKNLSAAVRVAKPNDVIIVRGGIYRCSQTIHLDRSGEPGKPIVIKAYSNEMPIFDCSDIVFNSSYSSMEIRGAYWHIKGLVFINGAYDGVDIRGYGAHHNILEEIVAYDNRVTGMSIERGPAYNVILNCDSYKNFDRHWNGEGGDGFGLYWGVGKGNVVIGSRGWNNSDDGIDLFCSDEVVRVEHCYFWENGKNIWGHPFFAGNEGFKLGGGTGRHVIIACSSWGHPGIGFTLNGNTSGPTLLNCTAWNNDRNYEFGFGGWPEEGRKNSVFINNISYNGRRRGEFHPKAESNNNSWDSAPGITLTDADFLSLDDSKMSGPRNLDGSIPYNNFLKLAPGSAAIDAGVDVNMPYVGKAPDLGAFEYNPNEKSENYVKMLHQHVRDHDINKINQLLAAGTDINEKDWLGYAPLHWACYFGYTDLVELLLSKGADLHLISDTGRTPLEIANSMEYTMIADLLNEQGAKK